jgi:hypothetical protein
MTFKSNPLERNLFAGLSFLHVSDTTIPQHTTNKYGRSLIPRDRQTLLTTPTWQPEC